MVSIESKVDTSVNTSQAVFQKLTEVHLEVQKQRILCNDRHKDIDLKFEGLASEDDVLDTDTGVFEQMSGIEVKTLIAEEKKERQALQAKVEAMAHREKIHQAQKAAVEQAKSQWEMEQAKAREAEENATRAAKGATEETAKLKTARYGMYATIGVAIISAIASITIAVMNMGQ